MFSRPLESHRPPPQGNPGGSGQPQPPDLPEIKESLRRRLYLAAIACGIPVILTVWLLEYRSNGSYVSFFPLLLLVCLWAFYWVQRGKPLQPIERTMFSANALGIIIQFSTLNRAPASEIPMLLASTDLLLIANAILGYLIFSTRMAGYLILALYLLGLLISTLALASHTPHLLLTATRLHISVAAILLLLQVLAWYRSSFTRIYAERQYLEKVAFTDALTGLPNRRASYDAVERLIAAAQTGEAGSVILLDIDHFKRINDTYGHPIGDSVLQHLASVLSGPLRPGDLLGRWGGEEFLIVLPATALPDAHELAQHLQQALNTHLHPTVGLVTASFGVTHWQPQDDPSSLLLRADQALYQAKTTGRNRVTTCQELRVIPA